MVVMLVHQVIVRGRGHVRDKRRVRGKLRARARRKVKVAAVAVDRVSSKRRGVTSVRRPRPSVCIRYLPMRVLVRAGRWKTGLWLAELASMVNRRISGSWSIPVTGSRSMAS